MANENKPISGYPVETTITANSKVLGINDAGKARLFTLASLRTNNIGNFKTTDAAPPTPLLNQNYTLIGSAMGNTPSGTYTNLLMAASTPLVIPAAASGHAILNAHAVWNGTYWVPVWQDIVIPAQDLSGYVAKNPQTDYLMSLVKYTPNLYKAADVQPNKYIKPDTGVVTTLTNGIVSAYIPVVDTKQYSITSDIDLHLTSFKTIAFYDASTAVLGRSYYSGGAPVNTSCNVTYNSSFGWNTGALPAGTKFIVFTLRAADSTTYWSTANIVMRETGASQDIQSDIITDDTIQPYLDGFAPDVDFIDTVETKGVVGALPTSPNASGGTYTFLSPIVNSGKGVRYTYKANVTGTIYVQVQSRNVNTITIVDERAITVTTIGTEITVEFLDLEYVAGQYMGIRMSPTGVVGAQSGTDEQGGWFYTNSQIAKGGNYTDSNGATTNTIVMHRFELLGQVVTGPAFSKVKNAVEGVVGSGSSVSFHLGFFLGESHMAGVPSVLSPTKIPVGRGYNYRRSGATLAHLQDPTGNSTISAGPPGRGSMCVSFGAQILHQTSNTQGAIVVNSAEGGTTAVNQWANSGSSWANAVTDWANAITAIRNAGLIVSGCSITIALGSNDAAAATTNATFKAAMLDLISRARTLVNAGSTVPVILLETGSYTDGSNAAAVAYIQDAQNEIVRSEPNVFMGYSEKFAVSRGQMIDNIHASQVFNDLWGASSAIPSLAHGTGLRPTGV